MHNDEMRLDNKQFYDLLIAKGVHHFYHANTLATSITFIENGGLLSRGYVANNGFFQTYQTSDEDDKRCDVWDDVFMDTIDLHGFFPRQNLYGPVLFRFNLNFLLEEDLHIWVTKDNPIYWTNNLPLADKYFQDVNELRKRWNEFDTQKKMVTIRKPKRPILFSYLEEILIDDPQVSINQTINLHQELQAALYQSTEHSPHIRDLIHVRKCGRCFCRQNYLKDISVPDLARLFLPRDHAYYG